MPNARTTTVDYEQSSESGRERHVRVPYARQTDTTPTLHDPVQVTSLLVGASMCGTSITLDATYSESIVNFSAGAVYRHGVRNALTYNVGPPVTEATWVAINFGDPVYYDAEQDALSGNKLSTAPLSSAGAANSRFGIVIMRQDEDKDDFPKGDNTEGVSVVCAVLQTGVIES